MNQAFPRRATRDDIPFLAWCNQAATSPEPNFCYWDPLVQPTGTVTTTFLETLFRHDALAWGRVEEFFILEHAGQPIAGASAFTMDTGDYRPLRLERLSAVASDLGWSAQRCAIFKRLTSKSGVTRTTQHSRRKPRGSSNASRLSLKLEGRA